MGKILEFNDYIIEGDIVTILTNKRNGETFKILVDKSDLQKLIDLNNHWNLTWARNIHGYYAKHSITFLNENKQRKQTTIMMHRFLMDAKEEDVIDHINHNGLDNRKCNLRATKEKLNLTHRKTKNSNNKSGYRNVCWANVEKRWIVQLQINGENTRLGLFDDVHEAGKFAEEMRIKYYGEFAGST